MPSKPSASKHIARNRAPRVQIEYEVETNGAREKVELPFVMGVMAGLSGDPKEPLADVSQRKFVEFDAESFDKRMKAIKPRVAMTVPNTITGEGSLAVDISFESMDDFSPAAVARKVDALNQLLQARTQLSNLLTYVDVAGQKAEDVVSQVLNDPALLKSLTTTPKSAGNE